MRYFWLLLLVLLVAACGPAGGIDPEATTDTTTDVDTSESSELITTDSGLQYEIIEEGEGELPQQGNRVRVHYTGTLEDGTVFDSSQDGDPFTFALGTGSVIPGWDEGIALLPEGSTARLVIPPGLAYGAQGSPPVIPPNSTLTFEVELVEILPGAPAAPQTVDEDDYITTESGLMYYDIEEGEAGRTPEEGQPVRIHYTVWLEDGTKLDSSLDRDQPLVVPVGNDQLLPGWDEGLATMNVGGHRQLVLPPELAFGAQSPGGNVPDNATLIIEVELLELLAQGPDEPPEVDEDEFTETESGLRYYDVREGDGLQSETGQTVLVHYTGWLEDGTRFDSSYSRGEPLPFVLGAGNIIPGWEEGVAGMNVGGQRLLVIPAELAYGETGFGDIIPPNETLTFLVELVEIR